MKAFSPVPTRTPLSRLVFSDETEWIEARHLKDLLPVRRVVRHYRGARGRVVPIHSVRSLEAESLNEIQGFRVLVTSSGGGKDSRRQIAKRCGVSSKALDEYLMRVREANLSWPLPAEMDDAGVEARLYPPG